MNSAGRVRLGLAMAVLGAVAAHGAATIDDVLVRQLWPWSRDVAVEFVARDVPSGTYEQAELNLFDGEADLGRVPGCAFTSDRVLCCDGKQHVTFDPAKVPALVGRAKIARLRVTVAAEPLANQDEILYQIFDLTKQAGEPGALRCVTEEALTNGLWGAWSPHYWPNVTGVKTPIWLDVTNDVKWCTTHLVMRRIPAGKFMMGRANTEDVTMADDIYPQVEVTISKPYYIGVFPMTVKQYRLIEDLPWQGPEDVTPDEGTTCERMRGKWTAKNALYDWPNEKSVDPNSIIGHLRTRTGRAFDLPTEAQWEKSARAGANGVYYDGTLTTTAAKRTELAWCNNNSIVTTNAWYDPGVGLVKTNGITEAGVPYIYVRHRVGTRKPNNYGIYDTLGGVYEMVLDWQAGNISATLERTDPVGASEATNWNGPVPKRVCKGGSYVQDYTSVRLARRCQNPVNSSSNAYGYRLCCPAE